MFIGLIFFSVMIVGIPLLILARINNVGINYILAYNAYLEFCLDKRLIIKKPEEIMRPYWQIYIRIWDWSPRCCVSPYIWGFIKNYVRR